MVTLQGNAELEGIGKEILSCGRADYLRRMPLIVAPLFALNAL